MKLRLNFAPRMMLAMMLIVALVASSIFLATRGTLETAWREVFEARFVSQLDSLASLQKARLDNIQERCRELAATETVIQAVQSGEAALPAAIHTELLERARVVRDSASSFETLNQGRGPGRPPGIQDLPLGNPGSTPPGESTPSPPLPGGTGKAPGEPEPALAGLPPGSTNDRPQGPGLDRFRWVRPDSLDLALMDSQGNLHSLKPDAPADAQTEWLEKNKVNQVPQSQETTYLAVKREAGGRFHFPMLKEVILTPVYPPGSQTPAGALVVGLPLSTYGESALYDLSRRDKPGELLTGVWIDDQLFSRSIPRSSVGAVSQIVRERLKSTTTDKNHDIVWMDGVPHQLLFRALNPDSSLPRAWLITLYSLARLEAEQAALTQKVIGYSIMAFAATVLLSWWFSRHLVRPVQHLVEGTRRIKKGEYETRVPITTHDELAVLAVSFNEMAEGLKQRQRYRDILFQVSDDDIARQLIETASLGGERREISVLFCDIRNFTATTSGMAPEGIIDMLNEHMTALTEIVHRHHGVVDKFVGDLIMAIFGAPKSYGDDAGNAAACALEMVARRDELNETTAHPPLLMGIGIASGLAVAGCMGSEHRLNYTVLGEPVNLASRLCSAAGPREVIVDPETLELLGSQAEGRYLSPLNLKGFPAPVAPFHLSRLHLRVPSRQPLATAPARG